MPVTREQFAKGMTYDQYKAQMTRNRDRLDAAESRLKLDPADVAAFKKLSKPLNVLALAEDWCGDVIANLPIVGRLAQESGKLNLRILLRDQNDDVMQHYLNRGEFKSIPVFVFLDDGFKDVGVFTERPDSVTKLRAEQRKEIFAANPDLGSPDAPPDQMSEEARAKYQQLSAAKREETLDWANKEVVNQLRAIVAKAA